MTVLGEADAVRLGSVVPDAIYAGETKVWPVTFDPYSIPDLWAWLDASKLSAGPVTAWPNLGPGDAVSVVATPGMALVPAALGGKPVVRFKFGEGRVRSPWTPGIFDWTLVYLAAWVGPNSGRMWTVQYPPSNLLVGGHGSGFDLGYDNGEWRYGPSQVWPVGQWRMFGMDSQTGQGCGYYSHGVFSGPRTGGSGGMTGGWGLSGYDAVGPQESMDFDVAELLIYKRRLSDAERQTVEVYLLDKWGL